MASLVLGLLGFLAYFLYDVNSVTRKNPWMHRLFAVGSVFLLSATCLDILSAWNSGALRSPGSWLLAGGALVFGCVLLYTLFFSLPFEETYRSQNACRRVYDRGMYALCRHPGVLWFFFFYLLLGLACLPGRLLIHGMVFSLCNLLYVLFQDRWTFPRTFPDYAAYRKTVPFLLPTGRSIRTAWQTRKGAPDKGGAVL